MVTSLLRSWFRKSNSGSHRSRQTRRSKHRTTKAELLEDRCLLTGELTDGGLQMEVVTAYNYIIDSNVEAPSTKAPKAAYLGVTVSNIGSTALENIEINFGDLTNSSTGVGVAGVYPVTTIEEADPLRDYAGSFSLTHQGGAADATRFINLLEPNETVTVYALVTYPVVDSQNRTLAGRASVPEDDIVLNYDVWITGTEGSESRLVYDERTITGRNEIAAMANKISPNTSGKVPDKYLDAIEASLGWRPNPGTPRIAGAGITEGIWYDLGTIGFGFDNDGDLIPDRNAWMQPVGNAEIFDASTMRLAKCYGLVIVKLNDGTEKLIPLEDQWAAPIFCTTGNESQGWVTGIELDCWNGGSAATGMEAVQFVANPAGVR